MADASSGSGSGGSGNSGRSRRSNHSRPCKASKGSSSHSPGSNSVSSCNWARLNWPSSGESLGNSTELYESIDEDREMAKKAVAFVLNSTSKGVVSLCSEVSSILKAKRSLERTVSLQNKELDCLRSISIKVPSVSSNSGGSNRSQKKESQCKTSHKPLLIHRSTSPLFKEEASKCLNSCASQTEISSIDKEWSPNPKRSTSMSDRGCNTDGLGFVETKRKEELSPRLTSNSEWHMKVEQENVNLRNELHNLRNELESLKRKGTLPQIISEGQATVCKTASLTEKENKSKIVLPVSPSPRQMETLNQELELPHIPQARNQGQALDSKLTMCIQQKSRKGLRPFSSPIKVSPSPPAERHPMRAVDVHQQCKCIGCTTVASEEIQTALREHAHPPDKKSPRRPEILPRLGDHVVVRSYLTGVVRYIGPITGDTPFYIGLHLDAPVGNHNGSLDGRQFFSCPQNYGAFVPVEDVLCITSQKTAKLRRDARPSLTLARPRSLSTPIAGPVEPELPGVEAPV